MKSTDNQTKWQQDTISGKGFVAGSNSTTISGTTEVAFFLMKNPNASGKIVRIKIINTFLEANIASAATTFRIYRNPTITANGTAVTANNLLNGGAASVITVFKSPTISANGTFLGTIVSSESDFNFDKGLLINQNENILITADPQTTNLATFLTVYWTEE